MERWVYLDGKFLDRMSNTPEQIATSPGAEIVSVSTFTDRICGKSERVYLKSH